MSWSVLVVDDESETRWLLHLMLRPAGFKVYEARDGREALEKINQNRPDVVLLDLMMPGMNGIDVCKHLRSDPETADLPIIMLTVRTDAAAVREGVQTGMTRYITKPVPREELVATLFDVLGDTTSGTIS